MNCNLQSYATNVTSQFGEDGILAEILRRIGEGSRLCVEFGAWDGRHYSNTWRLWHQLDWRAVLIEGDPKRCAELREKLTAFPRVLMIEAYVSWEGERSLDALLAGARVIGPVDVLSIDIDGDDYHVFAAIENYLPRILLIEFNPTCPPGLNIVQSKGRRFGSSAESLLNLARRKGFMLAACTETNLILVRAEEFSALGIQPLTLESVMPCTHIVYMMTDYEGRPFISRVPIYMSSLPRAHWKSIVSGRANDWATFFEGNAEPVQLFSIKP